MSFRRQRNIPRGGRYRQVSLYHTDGQFGVVGGKGARCWHKGSVHYLVFCWHEGFNVILRFYTIGCAHNDSSLTRQWINANTICKIGSRWIEVCALCSFFLNIIQEFQWSRQLRGWILGAFFIGYIPFQLPSGWLVNRYGGKWPIFWGVGLLTLATFLSPVSARLSPYLLLLVQILKGIVCVSPF